jgi:4-hydroxybenzoate polyprenyltransferase
MLFFYAHYFIALAAVASFFQTWYLLDIQPTSAPAVLAGLIFFATLGVYNLHSFVGLGQLKKVPLDYSPRFSWLQNRPALIWANLFISALGLLLLGWQTSQNTQIQFLLPFLLGLAYVLPFGAGRRLRDVGLNKLFLLAFVWAWATVVLPFADVEFRLLWLPFLERALFIFALALPFDVRDLSLDKLEQVDTLAARLGAKNSVWLSVCLLLVWAAVAAWLYSAWVFVLAGLLSAVAVLGLRRWDNPPDWYFSVLLDGLIIIIFLLVFLT